jgi:hypothetical protein
VIRDENCAQGGPVCDHVEGRTEFRQRQARRDEALDSVPGEGIEPSWGRSGEQFEPRLYRSARGHGRYRVGQPVATNPTIEEKWVKDSQHFPAELPTFQVVAGANSHQMHYSVASLRWLGVVDANLSSRDQDCSGLAGLSQCPHLSPNHALIRGPFPRYQWSIQAGQAILLN